MSQKIVIGIKAEPELKETLTRVSKGNISKWIHEAIKEKLNKPSYASRLEIVEQKLKELEEISLNKVVPLTMSKYKLMIDNVEEVKKIILELRLKGHTFTHIANVLNQNGFKQKNGNNITKNNSRDFYKAHCE